MSLILTPFLKFSCTNFASVWVTHTCAFFPCSTNSNAAPHLVRSRTFLSDVGGRFDSISPKLWQKIWSNGQRLCLPRVLHGPAGQPRHLQWSRGRSFFNAPSPHPATLSSSLRVTLSSPHPVASIPLHASPPPPCQHVDQEHRDADNEPLLEDNPYIASNYADFHYGGRAMLEEN